MIELQANEKIMEELSLKLKDDVTITIPKKKKFSVKGKWRIDSKNLRHAIRAHRAKKRVKRARTDSVGIVCVVK